MLKTMIRATLIAAACGLSFGALARADEAKRLDIPSGDLTEALQKLSQQSGVELIYQSDQVRGLHTGGVAGEMTAQDAVTKLLNGTPLILKRDESGAMVIVAPGMGGATSLNEGARSTPYSTGGSPERGAEDGRMSAVLAQTEIQKSAQSESSGQRDAAATQKAGEAETRSSVTRLGEILVTAQKREERLQEVPMSIAVVTADEIDRRGLVDSEDYLRGIPGVNQVTDFGGGSVIIRGIETAPTGQNFSSGPTVATYFGETPTTNSAGLVGSSNVDVKLVDIERVEVLRGPQGTAFGNSSLGGAVRTIPVAPKLDKFEGKLGASYSDTSDTGGDNDMLQGVGNLPVIKDKFAVRAAAYQFDNSGYYRNRAGSDPAFQTAAAQYGAQAFATDEDEVGAYYAAGGRIAALIQATDDLEFTLSHLTQKTEIDGQAFANSGIFDQLILQVAPEHVVRGQEGGLFDTDMDLSNAMMEYRFGQANLLATFSHIESGGQSVLPFSYISTFNFAVPASTFGTAQHRENSGEIRLTTEFDGAWNFLGGVYAEEIEDDSFYDYLWYGSPESNFFGPDPSIATYVDQREQKQNAVFGEASWKLLPDLTFTGGVRAYEYERTVHVETSGFFGLANRTNDVDDSGTTFRGNLSYKLSADDLIYAGWSQGFRLGKPQPGLPAGLCDLDSDGFVDGTNTTIEQTQRVNSDEVDSYEIGGRFALLDRRLTIAADVYHIDWSGVPVRVLAPSCSIAYDANAGEAVSEGVELQAIFNFTQAFRMDVGGSWIRAELTSDAPGVDGFDGDRLPGSPEYNANLGLQYEFEIGGHNAYVRADSIYVGPFYGNLQQTADTRAGDYVKVDASARVTIRDLSIDLYVRNLTGADDFTYHGSFTGLGEFYGYRVQPRTIGVTATIRF